MQPIDVLPESNLNLITFDGRYYTFDVVYDSAADSVNYIIEPIAVVLPGNECTFLVAEPSADSVPDALSMASAYILSRIWNEVHTKLDYIKADNIAKFQKMVFILTDVYVDAEYVYFKFRLENSSNEPSDVDCIAFSFSA